MYRAEDMTPAVWDYIFLKAKYNNKTMPIAKHTLAKLRTEFEYFYPVDLRASGKDLIQVWFSINKNVTYWFFAMFCKSKKIMIDNVK